MKEIIIPNKLIELAEERDIPVAAASDYYLSKQAKKAVDHIKARLVKTNVFSTELDAGRALASLWKDYRNSDVTVNDKHQSNSYSSFVEKASESLDKILGKLPKSTPFKTKNDKNRIAVAGDFHFPFVNEKAFAKLLEDPASTLVIVGDFLDMYAASRFRKTSDRYRVSEELAIALTHLEKLANKFDKIYMIKGNHDHRVTKKLQDIMPEILPLIVDPIDLLASKFKNVEVISVAIPDSNNLIVDENIEMDYCGILNDCLFGHFNNFCGQDAVRKLEGWINQWDHILNFEDDVNVITQAHSHFLSMEYTPKGRLLLNTGCMCKVMEYQIEGHGRYRPPTVGYVALYVEDGLTNLSKTELIGIR